MSFRRWVLTGRTKISPPTPLQSKPFGLLLLSILMSNIGYAYVVARASEQCSRWVGTLRSVRYGGETGLPFIEPDPPPRRRRRSEHVPQHESRVPCPLERRVPYELGGVRTPRWFLDPNPDVCTPWLAAPSGGHLRLRRTVTGAPNLTRILTKPRSVVRCNEIVDEENDLL